MKKRFIGFTVIIIAIVLGFIIYSKKQIKEYSRKFDCFNTTCKITIYATTSKEKELKELVALYQKEETNITEEIQALNQTKGQVVVSNDFLEIMKKVNQMNVFVNNQTLISLWKDKLNQGKIPTTNELKQVSSYVNDFEIGKNTVTAKVYDINSDAYLFGYLTTKLEDYLYQHQITSYLIQLGSNITVGKHYKNKFHTAILHPITDEIIDIVKKNNVSIYTVGNDMTTVDGINYVAIIDPETKFPYNYHQSVTVVCTDAILANLLSYKLYSMNLEEGQEFVKNYDVENVIWVENDGEIETLAK